MKLMAMKNLSHFVRLVSSLDVAQLSIDRNEICQGETKRAWIGVNQEPTISRVLSALLAALYYASVEAF